jgi:hypothetical protein
VRAIDGIMYCTEHGGISTEGTDYHPDGLGCEYAERESVERCVLVPIYYDDVVERVMAVEKFLPSNQYPKVKAEATP